MPKPKSFSEAYPITCTTRELFVRQALPDLQVEVAEAVRGWVEAHGLDVNKVIVARPITRDTTKRTLTYWTRERGRMESMQVVEHAPPDAPKTWPTPFPSVLLQQPMPSVCPTCGRDAKKPIPTEETPSPADHIRPSERNEP